MATNREQSLQDQNKAIVAVYSHEFWGKCNINIVDELCSEDMLSNYPMHGPRRGKEAIKRMLSEFKEAFPNVSFHPYGPIPMIAEGNYVVTRWIGGGTHSGVAFSDLPAGALDQANIGREIHFSGTTIFTLRDGKIVEETGEEGALTALQQLGLVPPPNPSSGASRAV
ncbi:NTF2-like protein [Mollisia scopiformis]|uniref:NTF2-like protein n=1 Tax=Mollisia scopiformis TaxID=149040 RepID=A0A132B7N7_MOLSC|nr:NTF2-like protein [Mollisia scopiformis]KUJ07697.1 NTF2-like protein [Mollisia scopiformis]